MKQFLLFRKGNDCIPFNVHSVGENIDAQRSDLAGVTVLVNYSTMTGRWVIEVGGKGLSPLLEATNFAQQ